MATREITPRADSLLDVERTFWDRLAYFGRFLWRDRSGVVGLAEGDRPEEIDTRPPIVARAAADGTIRLETTPHLRHWTEESGGADDG